MKVAIFGRKIREDRGDFIPFLLKTLADHGIDIIIHEPFFRSIKKYSSIIKDPEFFNSYTEIAGKADFFFSIGGDGTFLQTIDFVRSSGIPVLGFNTGRLGFLSQVSFDEIEYAIKSLINNDFTIDERTLLSVESNTGVFGDLNFALNEITVLKKDPVSMITISVEVNDQFLNHYWADGLIVSTPTGSTAYSLSCGGPILSPDSRSFIITPIANHNLTVRPIVIPDTSIIKLNIEARNKKFLVSADSRIETLNVGNTLTIKKEDFCLQLVKLRKKNFFSAIRDKLMWGQDKRN